MALVFLIIFISFDSNACARTDIFFKKLQDDMGKILH
tara:strand:- start:224 stop:334 length:111 start_codon:yes stop_codon:yes gene_type:complete